MCVYVCVCVCLCMRMLLPVFFSPNPGTLGIRSSAEDGENGVELALMKKADPFVSQLRPGVRTHTLIVKPAPNPYI
jgi:hypothetical protein